MLMKSNSVMYALAVWKLHEADSHKTPFFCAMMPTIDNTAERKMLRNARKTRTHRVG